MTDHEKLIREARERAKSLAWLGGGGNQEAHVDTDLLRDSARKMSALADALEAHREAMRNLHDVSVDVVSEFDNHGTGLRNCFAERVAQARAILEGKKP